VACGQGRSGGHLEGGVAVCLAGHGSQADFACLPIEQPSSRLRFGMIFAGAEMGIEDALAARRVLEHLVDGVRSAGLLTFAIMIPVLVVAALFANFLRTAGKAGHQ
jgi:hypothetical protein